MVSIIVPVFNKSSYLSRFLMPLISYSGDALFEVIFIDDGSTDDSYNIIESVINKNGNLNAILYRQPNKGVSAARNKGIELSSGKYLWFVDADDVPNIDALDVLKYDKYLNDVVIFNYEIANENGLVIEERLVPENRRLTPSLDYVNIVNKHLVESIFNKLFLRDYIVRESITFDESCSYAEDFLFVSKSLLNTSHVKFISVCVYTYFLNAGSLISKPIHNFDEIHKKILYSHLSYSSKHSINVDEILTMFFVEYCYNSALNAVKLNNEVSNSLSRIRTEYVNLRSIADFKLEKPSGIGTKKRVAFLLFTLLRGKGTLTFFYIMFFFKYLMKR